MRITRRRVLVGLLVVVVVAGAVIALCVRLVLDPSVGPLPDRADAIVVFAGEHSRADLALQLAAEGRAGVVVLSNGSASPVTAPLCGQAQPFVVLCPRPDQLDTRGEARMFGDLARQHGWNDLIAVTGNYHVARARLLLERCWKGGTTFAPVSWNHVGLSATAHEVGGLIEASTLQRSC